MRLGKYGTVIGSFFLAALLGMPMWSSTSDNRHTAMPGTLNYVEGQASIGDQTLDSRAVGNTELQKGQVL